MFTFIPILVAVILTFIQTYLARTYKTTISFVLPILLTVFIIKTYHTYDLIVVLVLANLMFYLMAIATYFTKPKLQFKNYEDKKEKESI